MKKGESRLNTETDSSKRPKMQLQQQLSQQQQELLQQLQLLQHQYLMHHGKFKLKFRTLHQLPNLI